MRRGDECFNISAQYKEESMSLLSSGHGQTETLKLYLPQGPERPQTNTDHSVEMFMGCLDYFISHK